MRKGNWINNQLFKVASIILLLFGVFYFYKTNYIPKIYSDEYGYWAAASWFAGMDWSEITRMNGYYGYGYGFILSLFLRTSLLATDCYRLAIALNGFFIVVIFFIAHKLTKELLQKHCLKEQEICIVALLATIGTSTLYYTQYTMCECILTLVYWIVIYLAWLLLKEVTKIKIVLFLIANAFLTYIHIRSVGVVVVSCLFLLYLFYANNKLNMKVLVPIIIGMVILLIMGIIVKDLYQDSYILKNTHNMENYTSSANDFSAATSAVKKFLSIEGICNFIINLIGRIYYSVVGSFMLILIVFVALIQDIYKMYKDKKNINMYMPFLFLSLVAMISISALANIWGSKGRYDLLTYGRYHEFVMGPLIIYGIDCFLRLMREKHWRKTLCGIMCVSLIIGIIVHTIQIYDGTEGNAYAHSMWIYFWTHRLATKNIIFAATIIIIVLVFTIAVIVWKMSNESKIVLNICLCALLIFNIYAALYSYENGCLNWSSKLTIGAINFEQEIANKDYSVFYLNEDHLLIEPYQILLKKQKIHLIEDIEEYYNFKNDNSVLLISYKSEIKSELLKDMTFLREYGWVNAWN